MFTKAIEYDNTQKKYFINRRKAYKKIGDNDNYNKDILHLKNME